MGADLLLNYVEIAETKEKAQARLDKLQLTEADLGRFEDCGYYYFESEEFSPEIENQMRAKLQETLELVYSFAEGNTPRDVVSLTIDGNRTFLFTGGMSWGDDPSDSFTDLWLFFEFLGYPSHEAPDSEAVRQWKEEGK